LFSISVSPPALLQENGFTLLQENKSIKSGGDLSAATYIYDGNIKYVYQRPDGALKIRYYDNSDVLQIVDIED